MDKITNLMQSATSALFTVGTALVILACMWKAISAVLNGDAKGCVRIIVEYIIAYVLFVLIPTIFAMIKAALS